MLADSVPSSKTNIFQSKLYTLIYCRNFRTYSRCAMFDWSDTVFRRRNVTCRRISNTVLQPRDWGSEADSPEVCRLLSQVTDKLYYIMLYWVHLTWVGFELTASVVIGTDCKGSYKSTYHTITTAMAPNLVKEGNTAILYFYIYFLAHLAKGNVSFCHHLASVVCRHIFTF
jgi:hypothetical protein